MVVLPLGVKYKTSPLTVLLMVQRALAKQKTLPHGVWHTPDGDHCVVSRVRLTTPRTGRAAEDAIQALYFAIPHELRDKQRGMLGNTAPLREVRECTCFCYNDRLTKEQALAWFDDAIKRVEHYAP